MLEVLERSVSAKSLDLVSVGHRRANLDHVLDREVVEIRRHPEKPQTHAVEYLPIPTYRHASPLHLPSAAAGVPCQTAGIKYLQLAVLKFP